MKYFVAVAFILIIGSLARAVYFLLRGKGSDPRMVRAFGMRVGFSILLFVLILVMWKLGYIHPTGIRQYGG
jgi:branched-subunit amino acid transport protein AzlD